MTLNEFNQLSKEDAIVALQKCCVSKNWISNMINEMPFSSVDQLINTAASYLV